MTVESELGYVAAKSKGAHCLLQIGEYPVADGDVDEHKWHAGQNRLRIVRVLFTLNHNTFTFRTHVLDANKKDVSCLLTPMILKTPSTDANIK